MRSNSIRIAMMVGAGFALSTLHVDSWVLAQPAGVIGYEATVMEPLPTGDWTNVTALDEWGRVLGRSTTDGPTPTVVWVNGKPVALPLPPDVDWVREKSISPTSGIVIGSPYGREPRQPLVWTIGNLGFLPLMDGLEECLAAAVNDSGWIVGGCSTGSFGRPALWIRGQDPIDLGDLGGGQASAVDINARGWILGCSYRPGGKQDCWPVIWKPNGQIIDLFKNMKPNVSKLSPRTFNNHAEVLGTSPRGYYFYNRVVVNIPNSYGCTGSLDSYGINDAGLIVGRASDRTCTEFRATIWERITPLGDPAPQFDIHTIDEFLLRQPEIKLINAEDINNAGQIAADGASPDGDERGYLVTPYQFELAEPQPGVAGESNSIQVSGLESNQRVILAFGTESGAQPIGNGCLGGLVLIRDASTHPSMEAFADQSGVATFEVLVPKGVAGKTVRYQALAPDECEISHTVDYTFR